MMLEIDQQQQLLEWKKCNHDNQDVVVNKFVPQGQPAWVPWTVLDRLFLELKENIGHSGVKNVMDRLEGTVGKYLDLVEKVSQDMVVQRVG